MPHFKPMSQSIPVQRVLKCFTESGSKTEALAASGEGAKTPLVADDGLTCPQGKFPADPSQLAIGLCPEAGGRFSTFQNACVF